MITTTETTTLSLLALDCGCLTYGSLVTEFCPDHEPVTCEWCEEPVTDDTGSDYCNDLGQLHTRCHWASGCRVCDDTDD